MGEPVRPSEIPQSAAERDAGDAGRRDDAAGRREAERLRLVVEVAPRRAPLDARRFRVRVDAHRVHRRQVDHQPVVADGRARDVVPAAHDREPKIAIAGEIDGREHVGCARTPRDDRRLLVDHRVPHRACLVVPLAVRLEDLAA